MRIAETLGCRHSYMLSPGLFHDSGPATVKGSKIVEYLKTEASYRIVDLCRKPQSTCGKFVATARGRLSRRETNEPVATGISQRHLTPHQKLGIRSPEGGTCVPSLSVFNHCKVGTEEDIRKFWLATRTTTSRAVCGTNTRDNVLRQTLAAERGTRIQDSGVPSQANCPYCP